MSILLIYISSHQGKSMYASSLCDIKSVDERDFLVSERMKENGCREEHFFNQVMLNVFNVESGKELEWTVWSFVSDLTFYISKKILKYFLDTRY